MFQEFSLVGVFSLAAIGLQDGLRPFAPACSFVVSHVFALVCGHEHIDLGFRIHPEASLPPVVRWERARRVSRLPVPGRNLALVWCSIRLLLAQE